MNVSYWGCVIVVTSFDADCYQTPNYDTYESALIGLGIKSAQFNYEDIIGYQIVKLDRKANKTTIVYEKRVSANQEHAMRQYVKENYNEWFSLRKATETKWLNLYNFRDAVEDYLVGGGQHPLKGE